MDDAGNVTRPDLTAGIVISTLEDGGMLLGRAGDDDVVLARSGDELFAVGAHCTHYRGPLVDGLVVGDTVRCPWHHACFSLRSGEVLHAPALDPIACWRVERQGEMAFVREKLAEPQPSRAVRTTHTPSSVIIVGGGGAGLAAADVLRREGYDGPVTMLSADDSPPCDRPNLSKDYLAGTAQEDWMPLRPPEFYTERRIELLLGSRVSSIDVGGRHVQLEDGSRRAFGALLIATGADPVRLPIPGADQVQYLRSFADGRALVKKASGATRVAFLWDQTLQPQSGEASPAAPFAFGVEYDAAAINSALQSPDPFAVVRHRVRRASHGTHVTGIAAGNGRSHDADFPAGRFIGIAPRATIIFVQAKGGSNTVNVAQAVSYIFEKADRLGMPCVINISQGSNGGSHDGQSVVERAIDRRLEEKPGRAVVKSAGNLHAARSHASGRLVSGQTRQLAWRVRRRDTTENRIEIWHSSRDRLRARLRSPNDTWTDWVVPDGRFEQKANATIPHITIEAERFTALNGDTRISLSIESAPGQEIPAGNWIIEIEAVEVHDGNLDAWIERDDDYTSQFFGPDFDGQRTLSLPGTGHHSIAVANYDHLFIPPEINPSSSRGRTRDDRMKPEVAAPGTEIWSSSTA
jgi:nitrite reductase/ring-hydroxylating ferredoxin subunit